jgi:geranylgeranyl reductase family protein
MPHKKVVIVGAGPAGAYCAFELAKKGIYATVFDHSHPREKPCGGGITPKAILKFPFLKQFLSKGGHPTSFKMMSCTNRAVVATEPEQGFNISRLCLDEDILDMALQSGAEIVKEKVIDIQRQENCWKIKTDKLLFTAGTLVGADGARSIVRRNAVGHISKENLNLTYGYIATNVGEQYSVIKFLDAIPGYIWIFPRSNHYSVGIGSKLKYGSMVKKILDDFLLWYCPHFKVRSVFAALLPSATDPDFFMLPCTGEDWILVGDAAGHVDPLTGEGILYALWSGKLAAEAIARNDLKSYDEAWRKAYGNDFMNRCKMKDTFYDPLAIELSLVAGCLNKTYSWIK